MPGKVCATGTSDGTTPDGAASRAPVAAVATGVIRDDAAGLRSLLLHCERSCGVYLFGELLAAGGGSGTGISAFVPRESEQPAWFPERPRNRPCGAAQAA